MNIFFFHKRLILFLNYNEERKIKRNAINANLIIDSFVLHNIKSKLFHRCNTFIQLLVYNCIKIINNSNNNNIIHLEKQKKKK